MKMVIMMALIFFPRIKKSRNMFKRHHLTLDDSNDIENITLSESLKSTHVQWRNRQEYFSKGKNALYPAPPQHHTTFRDKNILWIKMGHVEGAQKL